MSYLGNKEVVENILHNVKNVIETTEEFISTRKIDDIDYCVFKELKNKFELDSKLASFLLDNNITNYSLYKKNLKKSIKLNKDKIQQILEFSDS